MKKKLFLLSVMMAGILSLFFAAPASASNFACTPGYWKQPHHWDSWVGFVPKGADADYFDEVFGVGPHMTLLEALRAQKKDPRIGTGLEAAFIRHATAALLNAAYGDSQDYWKYFGFDQDWIINYVNKYYGLRKAKQNLAWYNELEPCVLN